MFTHFLTEPRPGASGSQSSRSWPSDAPARDRAATLAPPGSTVTLELDVQTHDRYGRLLAYVWAGKVLVNLELVREGYACPLTIPPNVRHAGAVAQAAREARCW